MKCVEDFHGCKVDSFLWPLNWQCCSKVVFSQLWNALLEYFYTQQENISNMPLRFFFPLLQILHNTVYPSIHCPPLQIQICLKVYIFILCRVKGGIFFFFLKYFFGLFRLYWQSSWRVWTGSRVRDGEWHAAKGPGPGVEPGSAAEPSAHGSRALPTELCGAPKGGSWHQEWLQ